MISVVYDGWSPALSVTSVVLSILSMLSSSTEKVFISTRIVMIIVIESI